MNRAASLERDLTAWFAETASPRVPDYTDDILDLTAGTNQRPSWSFPERWLPMSVITLTRRTVKPRPWRAIGLLAVLALLLAAVAVYVGSRQRLPPPFGLAANGLVAYALNGDIFAVDPISGTRQAIATGPDMDREPRWSLDGTRVAFLRESGVNEMLVIVDRRSRDVLAMTQPLVGVDTDAVAWSPDGRSIAVGAQHGASRAIYIVDAGTGDLTPLDVGYLELDVYWRPPDGHQILFLGGTAANHSLFVVDIDDDTVKEVARPAIPDGLLRPNGWTPDGQRIIYMRGDGTGDRVVTHVLHLTTGEDVTIDAGFGHVSNAGDRLLALDGFGRMCIADIRGGPCVRIAQAFPAYGAGHAAGPHWSPDDEWIMTRFEDGSRARLIDPDGVSLDQPSWLSDGAESWQRVAP
jgi:Tol biopolymer transport system component